MPRTCTICTHDQRTAIDRALVGGESLRNIAQRTGTSITALHRHRRHLSATLVKAKEAQETARADSLLDQVKELAAEARDILRSTKASRPGTAVQAVKAAAQVLELQAKILGEIRAAATVNIALVQSPEWATLKGKLFSVLDRHPAVRQEIVAVIEGTPDA